MNRISTRMKRQSTSSAAWRARAIWGLLIVLVFPSGSILLAGDTHQASSVMGKDIFRVYCASCHGGEALGDGPVAEYLKIPPADLTAITLRNEGVFPGEQVALTIDGRKEVRGHGRSEMPVWGDAFRKTDDAMDEEGVKKKIADLVEFLRTIQKPAAAASE